jgi:hypothetical protein
MTISDVLLGLIVSLVNIVARHGEISLYVVETPDGARVKYYISGIRTAPT